MSRTETKDGVGTRLCTVWQTARAPRLIAYLYCLLSLVFLWLLLTTPSCAQITVVQLSDTHIGEPRAPHAAENLQQAVTMINARHPEVVILTGDIGENPQDWQQAKSILKGLDAPLYYVPGNHDVHTHDVQRYRDFFGKDYCSFRVRDVTFVVIDSQLLGTTIATKPKRRHRYLLTQRSNLTKCSPGCRIWPITSLPES